MIKFAIIDISGFPNGISDFKTGFNKTPKNVPNVSEDLLRIAWQCMKIVLII